MPLPKGIYADAAVRRAWIAEHRATLDVFERLTGKGVQPARATRQLGLTHAGIKSMQVSLADLEGGRLTGRAKTERIDLGLALLTVAHPPEPGREPLTAADIAAWCDCTPAAIQSIERRALRKLRDKLDAILRDQDRRQLGREAA